MDKGINGAFSPRNKDTNSVKSDQQKTDSTLLTIFHQNIRGIRSKSNELMCHLSYDQPHILCLTDHHLPYLEIQTLNIDNYRLGSYYGRKYILKLEYVCSFTKVKPFLL